MHIITLSLVILQAFLFLIVALRDTVQLPSIGRIKLNDIKAIRKENSKASLIFIIGMECLAVGFALVGTLIFGLKCKIPVWFLHYLLFLYVIYAYESIQTWYRPYIFGGTPEEKASFKKVYAHTHHTLPGKDDTIRPNTVYLILHLLVFACAILVVLLAWKKLGGYALMDALDLAEMV